MPVANKNTRRPHPPTKSTGKRQPSGTTHFQFRPNQFGRGMGGGRGVGSMSETEASQPPFEKRARQRHDPQRNPLTYARDDAVRGFPDSPRQRLLGSRHCVGGDGNDRGIFL